MKTPRTREELIELRARAFWEATNPPDYPPDMADIDWRVNRDVFVKGAIGSIEAEIAAGLVVVPRDGNKEMIFSCDFRKGDLLMKNPPSRSRPGGKFGR